MSTRHQCDDCATRFDVVTPVGAGVLATLGLGLATFVWLAPATRFASSGDRTGILVLVSALGLGLVGLAVRGLRNASLRPPWSD